MIKQLRFSLLLCALLFIVSACSEGTYSDLEEFVNKSGEGLQGKVDPLPEIKSFIQFTYQAFDIPDPFSPRKNQVKESRNMLQPDLKRPKELLEQFPLENLTMVGTLQRDKHIFALIRTADNTVHRVKIGNYLGQNYGLITGISDTEIKLKEIVQDSAHEWTERFSTLMLQTQEQKI
ncbi:MAG TPA: pilus assembly protein PilP [Nitrosomonas nitrosa]|jgi:type IV pilus assembly protein PilP|uniref:Type IV pilus assembly protein PilP n=1 Tax=Nitrosomonas nitrosa TaxID=52442 RepID=A0A1I4L0N6_9PROT|nr:pilus assembly protein PilP [Nitrosomonas nitrosa]MCO6434402.1 pilus assembly protein PilP [Nitrosomonas nitrosa]PTR04758.1 type IV pilus assembly protein PilP [Nitrosomonas nitrosa]CAE6503827.1 Type IV pilus assembly protein PilP [Nitrosomonas nitrosa]SFL84585.1 type IV pilus assembly protein PilP [Nitrosomonas nitrosa]HBZ29355.1 pilus assembly protein PilP [Nitrosomonas nitrosa]